MDATEVTPGAQLLGKYLNSRQITSAALARTVGVSAVTVHNWLLGRIRPRPEKRLLIAQFTGGTVEANAWLKRAERVAAGLPQIAKAA